MTSWMWRGQLVDETRFEELVQTLLQALEAEQAIWHERERSARHLLHLLERGRYVMAGPPAGGMEELLE